MIKVLAKAVWVSIAISFFSLESVFSYNSVYDDPVAIGPQFPLNWMYTNFEPESAWIDPRSPFKISLSFSDTNVFAHSKNSLIFLHERDYLDGDQFKTCDYKDSVPKSYYWNCKDQGYSFMFDGEIAKRKVDLSWAITDTFEFHYSYQDFRFTGGQMDHFIENFHSNTGLSNAGREWTSQNEFEIHVWDNESKRFLYQTTSTFNGYKRLSQTVGVKWHFLEIENMGAFAFKLSSNFHEENFTDLLNDATNDGYQHKDFDDFNTSIHYSMALNNWTFNAAIAATWISNQVFSDTPTTIRQFFFGANWKLSEKFLLIFQDMHYSSILPYDGQEPTQDDDFQEISMIGRYIFNPSSFLELGITEDFFLKGILANPARIDFAYYLNVTFVI